MSVEPIPPPRKKSLLGRETLTTEFTENTCPKEERSLSRGPMESPGQKTPEDCGQRPVSQEGQ